MRILASIALLAAVTVPAQLTAQCSKLEVSGGKPGTDLVLKLTGGNQNALTFLALSKATGTTAIKFGPLGTLNLGLASPVYLPLIGRTDRSGNLTVKFAIQQNTPAFDLQGQAVNARLEFKRGTPPTIGLKFCVSNVAAIKGGS